MIDAETDTHLWSESYDRELTDIFAIQDEISAAIVEALKAKLGLNVKVADRDMSAVNLDAHNEYLQGRFFIENRNQADLEKALAHFDRAVELSPEYAPAWMGKAWTSLFLSELNYGDIPREIALDQARVAIEKALKLDPDLAEAHGVMGLIESNSFNPDKAISHYKKALELNPNYADVYSWYALVLIDQPKKRFELYQKAVQLNPMSILANNGYVFDLVYYGRTDEAREVVEHMLSINASHHFAHVRLGQIYLVEGKYAESIIEFETAIKKIPENVGARLNAAYHLSTIGLGEKAASYVDETIASAVKYWFKGNDELYVSQIRAMFPRSENDSLGYWLLARAEVVAENYNEAAKYFKLTEFGEIDSERIYSYQQTGDSKNAKALLEKARIQLKSWMDAEAKYLRSANTIQPIALRAMEIAYLEGDIEKAIVSLKKAMEKNYIMNFEYKATPMYKKLREHSDWPAIIAESDKRAAEQRERYLKLVAEDAKITL